MARWRITVSGKGVRRDTVDKIAAKIVEKYGGEDKVSVTVEDASHPESRADRFQEAISLVSDAKSEFESLRDELQEWYESIPENLQAGGKADEVQSAIDELESIISSAEDLEGQDVSFPGMY